MPTTAEQLTFASMHAEHRLWEREQVMWWDDIEAWRQQHENAVRELDEIEGAVAELRQALDNHAEAVQRIEHSLHEHEQGLAAYVREGEGAEVQEPMMKNHRQQSDRHACQRKAHERIKKHHHVVLAHVNALKAAIDEAMLCGLASTSASRRCFIDLVVAF